MKRFKILTSLAFVFALLTPMIAHATFVAPKRIMIDHGRRAGGLTIYNKTDKPLAYTFEWERRAQSPTGERIVLKEGETLPGYRPADEYLIFSPRQVIVEPNSFQRVRILAKRPADLPEGEYHSHLKIKPEPLTQKNKENKVEGGLGGTLTFKTHLSMPVFLRHGKTYLDFELTNIELSKTAEGRDKVSFLINNKSTRSLYARHVISCTIGGQIQNFGLGVTRVYVEAQSVTDSWETSKKAPPLETCEQLELNVYGANDFEYKRSQAIKTYKLK